MLKTYRGSCLSGAVRFEADVDLEAGTTRCNCSFCSESRYWGAMVRPDSFRLLSGEGSLSEYQFSTMQGRQRFCSRCGTRPFSSGDIPALGGPFVSINIACLDGVPDEDLAGLPVLYCNGRVKTTGCTRLRRRATCNAVGRQLGH